MSKTLYYRDFNESDLKDIQSFDQEGLVPFLLDPFTFKRIVLEDEKGIILVGMRRAVNEFKIIPNNNRSNLELARAIKDAFEVGILDAELHLPTEVYSFITRGGEHYIKLLEKHMGFQPIQNALKRGV